MAIDPLEEAVKAKPILGISITFLLFAWVATALRFWTRTRIVKNIGVDDWTILVSLGLYTGLCIQLIRLAIDEITINLVENSDAFTGIATVSMSPTQLQDHTDCFIARHHHIWSLHHHHCLVQDLPSHLLSPCRQSEMATLDHLRFCRYLFPVWNSLALCRSVSMW